MQFRLKRKKLINFLNIRNIEIARMQHSNRVTIPVEVGKLVMIKNAYIQIKKSQESILIRNTKDHSN